jgi:hypothetical protein
MTVFVMTCVAALLILAVSRWLLVAKGIVDLKKEGMTTKTQRAKMT